MIMDFCLLICHFFMLVFVVILSSTIICKQVCFVLVASVYNFNVKQFKSKTPVFRFFSFVTSIHGKRRNFFVSELKNRFHGEMCEIRRTKQLDQRQSTRHL